MKHSKLAMLAAIAVSIVAAALAATAQAAPVAKVASVTPDNQAPGTLQVRWAIKQFTVSKNKLVATGEVIATYASTADTYVTRTPFTTAVNGVKAHGKTRKTKAATRICNVLNLNLAPIRLELLGLIVELDRVHL